MLQVQLIYDSFSMSESFEQTIDTKYLNQFASYINRIGTSVIIPREGEHLQFRAEWVNNEGNNASHVNTFRVTRVIHNITDKVLILSIREV